MKSMTHKRAGAAGFTLIEVMIATIVVMILAAIAWPSYAGYVVRAKRVEAISALMEVMQQQERLYSRRNTYVAFSREDNPDRLKWHSGPTALRSSHEISARACQDMPLSGCIELVAVPGAAGVDSAFRDAACGTLTLSSQGRRTPETPGCWQ